MGVCAIPVQALGLDDLVPSAPSDGACWDHSYSDAHLSRHPKQKVTEIRFHLQQWQGDYGFTIDVATRERAGTVIGICDADHDGAIVCDVACDVGTVLLRPSGDSGALLLEIGPSGRLHVNARCDGDGGAAPFLLDSQPDDQLFLLHPRPARACTVAPFKPFLDHRGD
ncbi:hypothetical protein MWU54_11660 [Marivita sp. S6314]|uniref:hypothetical protein n=1 Tax=Marivita sp. S6314 TaxID=2926406 RepID=UPI001FF3E541|nr:hypothetical protein [Marivita sp. S6314]MCK0150684.1 hypothetical protein [Marivita sp. S6314]